MEKINQISKKRTKSISKNSQHQDDEYSQYTNQIKQDLSNRNFLVKPQVFKKTIKASKETNKFLNRISEVASWKSISPVEQFYKHNYEIHHKIITSEDQCSICQFPYYSHKDDQPLHNMEINNFLENYNSHCEDKGEVIQLNHCLDHFFHTECIHQLLGNTSFIKCPNCFKIYGVLTGTQPKGTMKARILKNVHCDGFSCDTISIEYHFPSGKGYSGTGRTAFLPFNKEGIEILALLKVSFDRKLTFIVGTSLTTGVSNTTVWNGVHHKTNLTGGSAYWGYPDNTYFFRVRQELASKGVLEENIDKPLKQIASDLLGIKIK